MNADFRTLTYHVEGHVATLTLTRPDLLNRMDDLSSEEVVRVIESLRRPGEVRVLVMASTGKAFSAGGDLNEMRRQIESYERRMNAWEMGRRLIYGMTEIAVPVVVALHGDVYGVGTSMVLSADIIVASRNARIGDPHVKVGLVAGDGGTLVWPASFGMGKAKRHLLTGEPIAAEEAHRLGGVSDLVDTPEEVLPLAQKIATTIAELPPVAVQFTKRALNHVMKRAAVDAVEFSMALEQYGIERQDLREAIDAFMEKRKPVYRGI
ncbi:MAG: enoyl-CoA hydratase-related protein [Alphaproteobacteria bacterium]|nr:enoyl-CoA hydratase-related protein [Alphaproteobacteria bacterium]